LKVPDVKRLTDTDLLPLEQYARERTAWRERVIAHKKPRTLPVGPNTTWCFEDRLTVQYQIQEMLRAERTFEASGIADELAVYNPLVPDGANWKVTLLIEYPDALERERALARLRGIEGRCWVQATGHARVYAIAEEDLERENAEKTSAVHFLRFELTALMIAALRAAGALAIGIDHPLYTHRLEPVPAASLKALIADFD
jgi:hypothetical protein